MADDDLLQRAREARAKSELSYARMVGAVVALIIAAFVYAAWTGIADHRAASAFEDACSLRHGEVVDLDPRESYEVVLHRHVFTERGGRVCTYMDVPAP